MEIAILGTRGIPNNYGGFEQCAEELSKYFISKGHDVVVYNPKEHPYKGKTWRNVQIERIYSNEKIFGPFSTFIFDYISLKHSLKQNSDILLELGYNPAGIYFSFAKKSKSKLVVNMDGLEWKRSKWNKLIQKVSLFCEKKGALNSDMMVADNIGIKDYLEEKYKKEAVFIPYGAEIFINFKESILKDYNVVNDNYYMLIARLEKENNIEMIFDGYNENLTEAPFLVIGNHQTKYGNFLKEKYKNNKQIRFLGGIYNYNHLSNLRHFASLYFHGHTVGGTNPSLLEAMASRTKIAAHGNSFNKSVLEGNALFFSSAEEVTKLITLNKFNNDWLDKNIYLVEDKYNWETVSQQYLDLFTSLLSN